MGSNEFDNNEKRERRLTRGEQTTSSEKNLERLRDIVKSLMFPPFDAIQNPRFTDKDIKE